jgi:cyclic pyranopterin phosphate synthase
LPVSGAKLLRFLNQLDQHQDFTNRDTNLEERLVAPLSHFDDHGASRMVDVGDKQLTFRQARAIAYVSMLPETLRRILDRNVEKGNVFEVARLAGIQATKRTADLIPLCHPLGIDSASISIEAADDRTVRVESCVSVHGRTGVEMEALTAVSVAALTIYDMCKSVDRGMTIGPIGLVEKSGGKSGHFRRDLQHGAHEG